MFDSQKFYGCSGKVGFAHSTQLSSIKSNVTFKFGTFYIFCPFYFMTAMRFADVEMKREREREGEEKLQEYFYL